MENGILELLVDGREADETPETAPWELQGRPAPDDPVLVIRVTPYPFTVGRHADNRLCLVNPTVSGRHAELFLDRGDLWVRDLDSTNGTFVNGRRIGKPQRLTDSCSIQFGTAVFTVRRCAAYDMSRTQTAEVTGQAMAYALFDKLLDGTAVTPHFQPIVHLGDARRVGYEVLARSRLIGLESPALMFRVAADRNQEIQLSCLMRREGLRIARTLDPSSHIYLNTHPSELHHPGLLHSLRQLREEFPDLPVVLEIHEAAATSTCLLAVLRKRCSDLCIRLAYDDFGAGQSRLLELAEVPPDVIKFDMHLIRGINSAARERWTMLASLVQIVRDLGVTPLAEGIETAEEAEACAEMGFTLAQGYYFGRPAPAPAWLPKEPK